MDFNRKELAVRAGVTPALVTYYFQDQLSLIEAVVQPIVQRYLNQLHDVLASAEPFEIKLANLVRLFLRISRDDGRLLDGYIDLIRREDTHKLPFMAQAYQALTAFFEQCEDEKHFRPTNIAFSQTLLWGACKIVAQTTALSAFLTAGAAEAGEVEDMQTAMIVDFLLQGLAARP